MSVLSTLLKPFQRAKAQPHADERVFRIDCTLDYEVSAPTEFIFLLHAMDGMGQRLLSESLDVGLGNDQGVRHRVFADPLDGHRFTRIEVQQGGLHVHYTATVAKPPVADERIAVEHPVNELPDGLLQHLVPTRYCESDHLSRAAQKIFGGVPPGLGRVQAISDWIHDNVEYVIGSTTATTTAREVFVQRAGVCRDFAHLGVTFCRALNIPARLAVGYARFDTPPPDFHAVFEAWLGGRWVLFDPTRMSPVQNLVRIASGRDAKDVAFATLFGPARMTAMAPEIEQISGPVFVPDWTRAAVSAP